MPNSEMAVPEEFAEIYESSKLLLGANPIKNSLGEGIRILIQRIAKLEAELKGIRDAATEALRVWNTPDHELTALSEALESLRSRLLEGKQ